MGNTKNPFSIRDACMDVAWQCGNCEVVCQEEWDKVLTSVVYAIALSVS